MNYRLSYLRDTAIGRFIEEKTIKDINLIMHYNNADIIQYFLNSKDLLQQLIERIFSDDLTMKNEGILFILELILCSKELVRYLI